MSGHLFYLLWPHGVVALHNFAEGVLSVSNAVIRNVMGDCHASERAHGLPCKTSVITTIPQCPRHARTHTCVLSAAQNEQSSCPLRLRRPAQVKTRPKYSAHFNTALTAALKKSFQSRNRLHAAGGRAQH